MTNQPIDRREEVRAKAQDLRVAATEKMGSLWWTFALRGVLAALLGLAALFWPQASLSMLLRIAGIVLILDGVMTLFRQKETGDAGSDSGAGLISVVIGLLLTILPSASARIAFVLVGVWALITGVNYLMEWWRTPEDAPERDAARNAGFLASGAGLGLVLWPGIGQALSGWVLALAAFAIAAAMLSLASKFKSMQAVLKNGTQD